MTEGLEPSARRYELCYTLYVWCSGQIFLTDDLEVWKPYYRVDLFATRRLWRYIGRSTYHACVVSACIVLLPNITLVLCTSTALNNATYIALSTTLFALPLPCGYLVCISLFNWYGIQFRSRPHTHMYEPFKYMHW